MAAPNVENLLRQIAALPVSEQEFLRRALDELLLDAIERDDESSDGTSEIISPSKEARIRWFKSHPLMEVRGEPLSEIIIRERR